MGLSPVRWSNRHIVIDDVFRLLLRPFLLDGVVRGAWRRLITVGFGQPNVNLRVADESVHRFVGGVREFVATKWVQGFVRSERSTAPRRVGFPNVFLTRHFVIVAVRVRHNRIDVSSLTVS